MRSLLCSPTFFIPGGMEIRRSRRANTEHPANSRKAFHHGNRLTAATIIKTYSALRWKGRRIRSTCRFRKRFPARLPAATPLGKQTRGGDIRTGRTNVRFVPAAVLVKVRCCRFFCHRSLQVPQEPVAHGDVLIPTHPLRQLQCGALRTVLDIAAPPNEMTPALKTPPQSALVFHAGLPLGHA